MKDYVGPRQCALSDKLQEVVLVDVVANLAIDQIAKLLTARQVVDGDDVRSPRSFSAQTLLAPIKPAAPVTIIFHVGPPSSSS